MNATTEAVSAGRVNFHRSTVAAWWLLAYALFSPPIARADQGALAFEAGGGGALVALPAPAGQSPSSSLGTPGTLALATLGLRYGLTHHLELVAEGSWSPPVQFAHAGVVVQNERGAFPGTLQHGYQALGAAAGARWVTGLVLRPFVQAELGWTRQRFTGLQHVDLSRIVGPVDYGFSFEPITRDDVSAAAGGGVEWQFLDHWSLGARAAVTRIFGPLGAWGLEARVALAGVLYL